MSTQIKNFYGTAVPHVHCHNYTTGRCFIFDIHIKQAECPAPFSSNQFKHTPIWLKDFLLTKFTKSPAHVPPLFCNSSREHFVKVLHTCQLNPPLWLIFRPAPKWKRNPRPRRLGAFLDELPQWCTRWEEERLHCQEIWVNVLPFSLFLFFKINQWSSKWATL